MPKPLAKLCLALDLLWLVLLGAFVFAIPPTFHGDEAMQIDMSRDYTTALVEHNLAALMTAPPYAIDSDAELRLINGSVNRYAIGLTWQLAGFTLSDLPPHPGWDWGLDYRANVSTGHLPSAAQMAAARISSTLFLALSVAVMFALGWQFGGRPLAYLVSALYAVNPVVLLNGRRALQEGSMLFFGLVVVLVAMVISRRRAESKPVALCWWAALVLAGGLTLASKQNGIVFVAGALGWILLSEWMRRHWRDLLLMALRLISCTVFISAWFVVLSPALWNDPPARFVDLLQARAQLLDIQVASDSLAPTTLVQRVEGIITQPFMTAPQHFEVAFWANFKAVTDAVSQYMASPFSGVQFGLVLGGALTLLAGVGIVLSLRRDWRAGTLVWLLVTVASLLVNPLPWQRYYLPLYPLATLLAGVGLYGLMRSQRLRLGKLKAFHVLALRHGALSGNVNSSLR